MMRQDMSPIDEELRSVSIVQNNNEKGHMEVQAEEPVEELAFRRCPFWTGHLIWTMLALGPWGALLFVKGAAYFGVPPTANMFVGLGVTGFFVTVLLQMLWRFLTRSHHAPRIQLFLDRIVFPINCDTAKTCQIAYEDVRSLSVWGKASSARMIVDTRDQVLVFPLSSILDPHPVERLRTRISEHMLHRHRGVDYLAKMKARELLGEAALQQSPIFTYGLLAFCAGLFVVEQFFGALDDPLKLIAMGANAPALVRDGQFSRLVSANFLHINFVHITVNSIALLSLGGLLERLVGPWRFLLIFGAGAIGGSCASAIHSSALFSVGASTALFGLFGSLAVIHWRFRESLPGGFRQTPLWWLYMLSINAAIPAFVPQIDGAAHVGGFLAGLLLTAILCANVSSIDRRVPSPVWVKHAAFLAAGTFMITVVHEGDDL